MWVSFDGSKGGRDRISPVLPKYREHIERVLQNKDKNTRLFSKISHSADIHAYRGNYTRTLYKKVGEDKELKKTY